MGTNRSIHGPHGIVVSCDGWRRLEPNATDGDVEFARKLNPDCSRVWVRVGIVYGRFSGEAQADLVHLETYRQQQNYR